MSHLSHDFHNEWYSIVLRYTTSDLQGETLEATEALHLANSRIHELEAVVARQNGIIRRSCIVIVCAFDCIILYTCPV